jgi:hypothetical protein
MSATSQKPESMLTISDQPKTDPVTMAAGRVESVPSSISIDIEELVLHGFPPGDGYRISEAVERELSRLLSDGGAAFSFGTESQADHVDAEPIRLTPGARPNAVGNQVAGAIYGGLNR